MKHLSKIIILLLISLFVFTCQNDDNYNDTPNIQQENTASKFKRIYGKQIPKNITNYILEKTNNTLQFDISGKQIIPITSNDINFYRENLEIGTVNTDVSAMVVNETNTKYTFVMTNSDTASKHNLIVVDFNGDLLNYYIKYSPDETWAQTHDLDKDMNTYTGTITFYSKTGIETGTIALVDGQIDPDNSDVYVYDPCDPDSLPDGWEDNDSTGSGGNGGYDSDGNNDSDGADYGTGGSGGGGSEMCSFTLGMTCDDVGQHTDPNDPQCYAGNKAWSITISIPCNGDPSSRNSQNSRGGEVEDPCPEGDVAALLDEDDDCDTSKEDLKKVFPNMSDTKASTLASVINDKGEDFGIDTEEKLQHFLAQAGHEVGGFNNGIGIEESLYYTTASRLKSVYKKYFEQNAADTTGTKRKADSTYLQNSSKVANYVYCCRMGNGNEASGDGYKYRGRGIFQLTGKTNYTSFKTWYNNKYDPDKDFVSSPGMLKDNDTIAILSALWYYKTSVLDKITVDSTTTVLAVTKKVNGGKNGLSDRKEIHTKAKDSITCL